MLQENKRANEHRHIYAGKYTRAHTRQQDRVLTMLMLSGTVTPPPLKGWFQGHNSEWDRQTEMFITALFMQGGNLCWKASMLELGEVDISHSTFS